MQKILLLVEDEAIVRFYMNIIVSNYDYKPILGKDGKEGVELFQKYGADLIITDIYMDKYDGYYFIKEIRKIDKKVPIYTLSAMNCNIDGVQGHIRKPIDLNFIENLLKNHNP